MPKSKQSQQSKQQSNQPSERFRAAPEFPKSIEQFNSTEANQLYVEMRDCLIFTNRSRGQLIRRNEEHKHKIQTLQTNTAKLDLLISQLNLEKQELSASKQATISELKQELQNMTGHLDVLSRAFEDVEDVNGAMSVLSIPTRFNRFWQALKALILWWREESGEEEVMANRSLPPSSNRANDENDRHDNPQMYSDPASIQRSERDW